MRRSIGVLRTILLVGDLALMYAALLLTLAVRFIDFSYPPGPDALFEAFLFHFLFISCAWIVFLFVFDFYELPLFRDNLWKTLIKFVAVAGSFGMAYFYLQPQLAIAPKTILLIDVFVFSIFLIGWRLLVFRFVEQERFKEKILIVGYQPELKEVLEKYAPETHFEIVAFFLPSGEGAEIVESFAKKSRLGFIRTWKELDRIRAEEIHTVVLALDPHTEKEKINQLFSFFPPYMQYMLFPEFYETLTKKASLEMINEFWFLDHTSPNKGSLEEATKRMFDIMLSVIGLTVFMVLFPIAAFAIKLTSPGPIFFTQQRMGRYGKSFTVYKLRTMTHQQGDSTLLWRELNKGEITRVGKILRKLEIDEFPQFWNILWGSMSVVGPRPEWVELARMFEQEISFYKYRYLIRPGFTGWAQLHFPPSTSIEQGREKFQYDLYYIKHRSFFLDLAILVKTLRFLLR